MQSGQTERQLAALARSHEKLSSNFEGEFVTLFVVWTELGSFFCLGNGKYSMTDSGIHRSDVAAELKMFVGKGQMPVARNKPARGATRAERTQHSSASFPKVPSQKICLESALFSTHRQDRSCC